jgi:hypothetical protein
MDFVLIGQIFLPGGSSIRQSVGAERIVLFFLVVVLLALSAARSAAGQQGKSYSVMDFHAAGDGNTDDAKVTTARACYMILASPSRC